MIEVKERSHPETRSCSYKMICVQKAPEKESYRCDCLITNVFIQIPSFFVMHYHWDANAMHNMKRLSLHFPLTDPNIFIEESNNLHYRTMIFRLKQP